MDLNLIDGIVFQKSRCGCRAAFNVDRGKRQLVEFLPDFFTVELPVVILNLYAVVDALMWFGGDLQEPLCIGAADRC